MNRIKPMADRLLAGVACCVLSLAAASVAAEPPSRYIGEAHCLVAAVEPAPANDRISWKGPCKDGYAEGKGVLEWRGPDRAYYRVDGTLVRGAVSGEATRKSKRGTYTGMLRNGLAHGQGYFQCECGAQYEGSYVNGKREGQGTYLDAIGSEYQGQWKDDKRNGLGKEKFALGGSYDGEWKDDKFHGKGTIVYAGSGRKYEGLFEEGRVAGTPPREIAPSGSYPVHGVRSTAFNFVPTQASWSALTIGQQNRVRAQYEALEDGDEPPYPIEGVREFFRAVTNINSFQGPADGTLHLLVLVGADGQAKSVRAIGAPDKEMVRPVSTVAMLQRYKPALCRGQPCEMMYAVSFGFSVVR